MNLGSHITELKIIIGIAKTHVAPERFAKLFSKDREKYNDDLNGRTVRMNDGERITRQDFSRPSSDIVLNENDNSASQKDKKMGSHRLSELHSFRSKFK